MLATAYPEHRILDVCAGPYAVVIGSLKSPTKKLDVNLAIFTHILPVKLIGRLAKYLDFKQMISGQGFCTILAFNI